MTNPDAVMRRVLPLFGIAVIASIFAALYPNDPSTAWGVLCGGGVAVVALAAYMARRRGDDGDTLSRSLRGEADERDQGILQRAGNAAASVGYLACLIGMAAIARDVDPMKAIAGVIWVMILTHVGYGFWLSRTQ